MLAAISLSFLCLCFTIYTIFFVRRSLNPLYKLPGPPVRGFFGSHLKHVTGAQSGYKVYEFLEKRYGRSVRIRGAFPWEERLLTMDPVSMAHILKNADLYQKPALSRRLITSLIGCGMLAAEGHVYQRQRRKGIQLKEKWLEIMKGASLNEGAMTLDIGSWISRATFDVMGLAGFDYDFNAIEDESNPLFRAYVEMFQKCAAQHGLWETVAAYSPLFRWLFPDRVAQRCRSTIHRIAGRLIQEKKQKLAHDEKNEHLQSGNDLLTLMLKSNSDPALPPEAKMSDGDLLDNINTLMFAGSDTSSLSVIWTLVLLARNTSIQDQLRNELLSILPANHGLSDLEGESLQKVVSSLPLLNNVLRESLRLISPVHSSLRVATRTDEVPTMYPVRPRDKRQPETQSFTVPKGTFIHICVEAFNLDKTVWGEDAWEFNPDRWDCLPDRVSRQPGVFSHLLTFSAGPRACTGMRVSLTEMKLLLFILLTNFTFKTHPEYQILKVNKVLTRPHLAGKEADGMQCPLLVSRFQQIQ
ncbi:cytochrome-450 hydroxylase [Hymenopellis radicata]|nr:cytochrome-450 hydroxylase [Hymenopellis radicata]